MASIGKVCDMNCNFKHLIPVLFSFVIFSTMITCSMAETSIRDPKVLREKLEEIRNKRKLPAIAASVVIGNDVIVASVVGQRKLGESVPVTRDDPFELGSITKPLTGTLVGVLKDQGKLDWDTTIGEVFPEIFPKCQPVYKNVTVRQLLSHTSGLPYKPTMSRIDINAKGSTVIEQRLAYVSAALINMPEAYPGSRYIYSGGGVIVASMAEKITGKSWEELVAENVFQKLDMKTAGFGQMAAFPHRVDAPWFHRLKNGKIVPLEPNASRYDKCRSPVGGVHCSIIDLGKFAAFHLTAAQHKPQPVNFIKSQTIRELYSVVRTGKKQSKRYTTCGWRMQETDWAKGHVFWHAGSCKSRGYALLHFVPAQNYATCVMMNIGGEQAIQAGREVHLFIVEALRKAGYTPKLLFADN
jgi:CubicO group peptidase (beta-lactamase class C family)